MVYTDDNREELPMKIPDTLDLSALPKPVRKQVYDFYLLVIQKSRRRVRAVPECAVLSESVLAKDWLSEAEEDAWREFQ